MSNKLKICFSNASRTVFNKKGSSRILHIREALTVFYGVIVHREDITVNAVTIEGFITIKVGSLVRWWQQILVQQSQILWLANVQFQVKYWKKKNVFHVFDVYETEIIHVDDSPRCDFKRYIEYTESVAVAGHHRSPLLHRFLSCVLNIVREMQQPLLPFERVDPRGCLLLRMTNRNQKAFGGSDESANRCFGEVP